MSWTPCTTRGTCSGFLKVAPKNDVFLCAWFAKLSNFHYMDSLQSYDSVDYHILVSIAAIEKVTKDQLRRYLYTRTQFSVMTCVERR